jgi:hypothetical protein
MAEKPGKNSPDKDIPLHGIEKKGDKSCQHDYCPGPDCRLDVAADAIKQAFGALRLRSWSAGPELLDCCSKPATILAGRTCFSHSTNPSVC